MKARLAAGHGPTLQPVANWDLAALAGAGALRSTTNDLLTFLAANLGYVKTPLAPAMAAMLKVRRPTTAPNLAVALGWHVFSVHDKEIVWHNGGTGRLPHLHRLRSEGARRRGRAVERRHACRPGRHRPSPAGLGVSAARATGGAENADRGRDRPGAVRQVRRTLSARAGRDHHRDARRQPPVRAADRSAEVRGLRGGADRISS